MLQWMGEELAWKTAMKSRRWVQEFSSAGKQLIIARKQGASSWENNKITGFAVQNVPSIRVGHTYNKSRKMAGKRGGKVSIFDEGLWYIISHSVFLFFSKKNTQQKGKLCSNSVLWTWMAWRVWVPGQFFFVYHAIFRCWEISEIKWWGKNYIPKRKENLDKKTIGTPRKHKKKKEGVESLTPLVIHLPRIPVQSWVGTTDSLQGSGHNNANRAAMKPTPRSDTSRVAGPRSQQTCRPGVAGVRLGPMGTLRRQVGAGVAAAGEKENPMPFIPIIIPTSQTSMKNCLTTR